MSNSRSTNFNRTNSRTNHHHQPDDDDPNEDDEWLFESVVAYLHSPIWTIPIQHFIEKHCQVFSPNDGWSGGAYLNDSEFGDDNEGDDYDESMPIEYLDIHLKYKDLVDALINTFLQDIGVSYNKFLKACKKSTRFTQHPIYLELFEQVWCAENFKMFKSQMVRKNIELELQALVLLQHQLGLIKTDSSTNDDEIMAIVIKKSKDEYDLIMGNRNSNQRSSSYNTESNVADLETAKKIVNKSEKLVETIKHDLNQQDNITRKIVEEQLKAEDEPARKERPSSAKPIANDISYNINKMKLDDYTYNNKSSRKTDSRDDFDDENDVKIYSGNTRPSSSRVQSARNRDPQAASAQVNNLAQNYLAQAGGNINENELQRRAEFMKKQRELLTEKKRVERQKQLDKFMYESERSGEPKRPMSSRAARSLLQGAEPEELIESSSSSSLSRSQQEERKRLEARKALAETLKKEVINNSTNRQTK